MARGGFAEVGRGLRRGISGGRVLCKARSRRGRLRIWRAVVVVADWREILRLMRVVLVIWRYCNGGSRRRRHIARPCVGVVFSCDVKMPVVGRYKTSTGRMSTASLQSRHPGLQDVSLAVAEI